MKTLKILIVMTISVLPSMAQHITFDGISMMQSLEQFRKELEAKNYYIWLNDDRYIMVSGEFLGEEPSFFTVDSYSNYINQVDLGYSFATQREAAAFKLSAIKQLENIYPKFTSSPTESGGRSIDGKNGWILVVMGKKTEFAGGDKIYPQNHQYVVSITFSANPDNEYLNYIPVQKGVVITESPAAAKKHLTIPSTITINDEPVKVLGVAAGAFSNYDDLESLTVGDGVEFLGEKAFAWCGKLANVQFGEGLTYIGKSAFYGADSLRNIVLPATLQEIGTEVFWNCHNLTSIKVRSGSNYLKSDGRVLYSADGTTLICMPQAYNGTYHVPDGVKHIAAWGMVADSLKSVTLPNGLLTIGENAFFWDTKLKSVNLPTTLRSIGEGAFVQCHSLEEIIIPEGISELSRSLFYNCQSLSHIVLPQSITTIGNGTFDGCKTLQNLVVPSGLVNVGDNAFSGCAALQKIELPATLKYIGTAPFASCSSLLSIQVDASNMHYASVDNMLLNKDKNTLLAFPGGITSYTIPEGIDTIAQDAFRGSKLKEIKLPSSLRYIGANAFKFSDLREVVIPEGVTFIGEGAFDGWKLEVVHLPSTLTTIGEDAFESGSVLYVPDAMFSKYTSGSLKLSARYSTPPAVKAESEYVPSKKITLTDLTQKLLGLVQIKMPMWKYSFDELRAFIPDNIPVTEPTNPSDFALEAAQRLDLTIGSKSYKVNFVRFYLSPDGRADVQETSIDCGDETEFVARAAVEQASKLKFKIEKRDSNNGNNVMMIDSKKNTVLFIIEDKNWERVFIATVDINSSKLENLKSRFD